MAKKVSSKNTTTKLLRYLLPLVLLVSLLGVTVYTSAASNPTTLPTTKKVIIENTGKVAQPSKSPVSLPAKTAPAAALPSTKTLPVAAPVPSQVVTTAAKPAPVVVPVPNSSVSNLTPATPTTSIAPSVSTATGSGNSSSSGSSTSSGSSSSSSSPGPSPPQQTSSYTSTNWSGYLATGGTYSAISADWVVPTVTGNGSTTSADGTWIGIGGVTSNDLIQIGTEDNVSVNGHVSTEAFYELLPDVSQTVPGVTVSAGDMINASITQALSGLWTFYLIDQTTGQSYTQTVGYTSSNSSAEWIEEDPSYSNGRQIPFDNYGNVAFTDASTTMNGSAFNLLTSNAQPVTMVSSHNGTVVATPSSVGSDGTDFTVSHP